MWNLEWDRLSVYPYREENIQEILCRIYSIIEELKANGQVVPPDLISDLKQVKKDIEAIKTTLPNEVQQKLDEALKKLNDNLDAYQYSYGYGSNVITDPFINDYVQELTGDDYSWAYNESRYGKFRLNVKNEVGVVTGYFNLAGDNATDYKTANQAKTHFNNGNNIKIIKPIIACKQPKAIVGSMTATNSSGNIITLPLVLNQNGGFSVDANTWIKNGDSHNREIAINFTLPIIKSYLREKDVTEVNNEIAKVSKQMNQQTSCVVVACDSHIRPTQDENTNLIEDDNNLYIPLLMNYINTRLGAFATINNGDTLHESNEVKTLNDAKWLMESVRKQYVDNTLFVLGNHDDQSMIIQDGNQITREDFNRWMNKGKTGINFAENDACYFFSDDVKGRCRHIFLNSHDREGRKIGIFEFSYGQINWLVRQLKNTPAGYSILLYSHISPMISPDMHYDPSSGQPIPDRMVNGTKLHQVLRDFINKTNGRVEIEGKGITYDFSNCKGLIAGFISGHDHIDKNETIDGVNYTIETATYQKDLAGRPPYTIALVDREHRKLKLLRSGGRASLYLDF